MPTPVGPLVDAAFEHHWEKLIDRANALGATAFVDSLSRIKVFLHGAFLAGAIHGANEVRAIDRGESNQEPPNDEAS